MDVLATRESPHSVPVFLVAGGATLVLGVAQLAVLNRGLGKHAAVAYLSTYKAVLTIYGVVAGGVCGGEFWDLERAQMAAFGAAVGVVVGGLMTLGEGDEEGNKEGGENNCEEEDLLL